MYTVMSQPSSYADCRRAVDRVFDLFPRDIAGKKVVIKPNVLMTIDVDACITCFCCQEICPEKAMTLQ